MAEINSRQAANLAAGTKMKPGDVMGKVKTIIITTPATHTLAQNDTIASGVPIPVGARILGASSVNTEGMGTSVTLSVGLRNFATKTVNSATAIASAVAVATAGASNLNNGTMTGSGVEAVTTEVSEAYLTIGGAAPTANKQLRVELQYLATD